MATNTSDFFTFSKTAGTAKNLQKPTDGGDNNLWGNYINVDMDTIVGAVNATSDLIADANQNELVDFTATGSAVNHVGITNAATGNGPTIEAKGDDSNVDLNVKPKGTGAILLKDGDGNELVKTSRTASAVNEITVANAATGNPPEIQATGDDTNINIKLTPKGSGSLQVGSVTDASVPQNLVAYRASGQSTPSGWSEYTSVRGRMIVGLPSGGTDGGTVGSAFSNQQDKSKDISHTHNLGSHTHQLAFRVDGGSVEVASQFGTYTNTKIGKAPGSSDGGSASFDLTSGPSTNTSGAMSANSTVSTSEVLGYIQLMAIKKD